MKIRSIALGPSEPMLSLDIWIATHPNRRHDKLAVVPSNTIHIVIMIRMTPFGKMFTPNCTCANQAHAQGNLLRLIFIPGTNRSRRGRRRCEVCRLHFENGLLCGVELPGDCTEARACPDLTQADRADGATSRVASWFFKQLAVTVLPLWIARNRECLTLSATW